MRFTGAKLRFWRDWLREEGHPKWNSADLEYPAKPKEINLALEAVKEMLQIAMSVTLLVLFS